jgi:hypothetical protein
VVLPQEEQQPSLQQLES